MERTATAPISDDDGSEALSVAVGDVIANKYRVDSVLGRGGMGVVLAATHLTLDERVALKMLRAALLADGDAVARFLREARAASKLKCPHVARVVDVDTLPGGAPYIVMEYLDGKDLADVLAAEAPLAISDAVTWVLEACEAVAEAHALRIVHRDLKPRNLFRSIGVDGKPVIKVLDFGVSRILDDAVMARGVETSASMIVGTPAYMAPEQHESARKADERSDIWALGVILFELLTGKRPFHGDSPVVVYATIVTAGTPSPRDARPEIPEGLANVVVRCLARDPVHRFQSAVELAAALSPFAADVGAAARVRDVDSARRVSSRRQKVESRPGVGEEVALEATELAPETRRTRRTRWQVLAAVALGCMALGGAMVAFKTLVMSPGKGPAPDVETVRLDAPVSAPPSSAFASAPGRVEPSPIDAPPGASPPGPAPSSAPSRRAARPGKATAREATPSPTPSSIDDSYRHRTSF